MSEQTMESTYKRQKALKPKIEDVIPVHLDGEIKELALDFTAFLRENRMSPTWASGNSWKSSYKGKGICYVKLTPGLKVGRNECSWVIAFMPRDRWELEKYLKEEKLLRVFTAKPWHCHGCGRPEGESCGCRRDDGLCGQCYLSWVCDPGTEAVDVLKRLIIREKGSR